MPITIPVDFDTNAGDLERDLSKSASKAGTSTGKSFGGGLVSGFKRFAGPLAAVAATVGVKDLLGDTLAEARESQKVGALTTQVIKRTGGAAKVTAAQVGDLATALSNKVGVDDEAIQTGANVLLGFKAIRNELGKGNKIFDRATKASVDLASTPLFNGNITGASKQLGKALNDPLKGITLLARAGITFTDQQKEQVKALVKTGDTLAAQRVIIKAVEDRYKGAAEAQATSSDKARVAIDNLKEQIGTALLPVVDDLANKVAKDVVPAVSDFITGMQDGTGAGGDFVDTAKDIADVLGNVVGVGKDVFGFFNGLPGPVKKLGVETLIAYAALRKITTLGGPLVSSISSWGTSLRTSATDLDNVANKSRRFGGALQTLAGAGGLIALQDGLGKSNTNLGKLESALGGAAVGFAVTGGNPLGALVGGLGGLYTAAFKAGNGVEAAGEQAKISIGPWQDYKSTLDDVTGSTTAATREMALQRLQTAQVLGLTKDLGLTDRQVVNATVNGGKARRQVVNTLLDERKAIDDNLAAREAAIRGEVNAGKLGVAIGVQQIRSAKEEAAARREGVDAVLKEVGATRQAIDSKRADIAANKDFGTSLDALPDRKQVKVEALGIVPTKRGIAEVAAEIKATPEEIKTLISATGVKATVADIDRVIARLREVDRIKATATVILNTIGGLLGREHGGPVRAGQPYVVGERRPEIFVPNQSGRIEPRVPSASNVSRETSSTGTTIILQNFGPRPGRQFLTELEWSLRFGTRSRGSSTALEGALSA